MNLETNKLYLYLLLFALSYPLAQSFEWRISYYKKWKNLLPAIGVMMLVFIPWDIYFTKINVWWFNDSYLLGFRIFGIPIEEWSFFVVVPFACVFIYEVLIYYIKKDVFISIARTVIAIFSSVFLLLGLVYLDKYYTASASLGAAIFGFFIVWKNPAWLGRFLMMYFVSLLPFLLVNGVLTGLFIAQPIVNYSPSEIIGTRILTIPIEDSIYSFFMLLLTIYVYEFTKTKKLEK